MLRRAMLLFVIGVSAAPTRAAADEIAPELASLELRQKAEGELRRAMHALGDRDRTRLSGLYLAFDPSGADPIAQVACDDDGDFVVVLSDAMLRLVANVARAQSYDEANAGSQRIEDYAGFVARSQVPGRRLLPPPPGFYAAVNPAASEEVRLREALAFVVAREIAHLREGDLVCPHPTPTKEAGDDVWTEGEQRAARDVATRVYPGSALRRDEAAIVNVIASGRSEAGAVGLLRFFTQFELERTIATGRFLPSYLVQHPGSSVRLAAARAVALRLHGAEPGPAKRAAPPP